MAFTVHIPKNLDDIEERLFFKLTKRQCVCFALAIAIAFPLYFLIKDLLSLDLALIVLMAVTFPIMYAAWYKKDGKRLEEILLLKYRHAVWQYQFRVKRMRKNAQNRK